MLIFSPLFGAPRFLSIKIVSQKWRKSNLFKPYTALKTSLILREVLVEISLESRLISTTAWERERSQAIGDWFPPGAEINPTMGRNSTTGPTQNQRRRASTLGACYLPNKSESANLHESSMTKQNRPGKLDFEDICFRPGKNFPRKFLKYPLIPAQSV